MASVTLRTKLIQKKGFSLFLDIYNEGQRYKEYLKLYVSKDYAKPENKNILKQDKDSWELAKAIQAKRIIQVKESAAGFIPKSNKQDFIAYYNKQAKIKEHFSYPHALRHLLIFIKKEQISFKQIDESFLKHFIDYLKSETDLSVTTIRMYLLRINIILNLAVADNIIQVNPFKYLKKGKGGDIPVKKQKKIEFLTIEELRKLQATPYRKQIKDYFLFCCFCGLRESDLLKLQWNDIEDATLVYTQTKQGDVKTHYLPLSKQALVLLEAVKQSQIEILGSNGDYVFEHIPLKRTVLWHLKKWIKKAEINKNLHMHVGRHTFATMALTNGVSLYTVSKLLGHSSIAMTQIYAEVIDEVKQKAADLIPML
jgi:integrase